MKLGVELLRTGVFDREEFAYPGVEERTVELPEFVLERPGKIRRAFGIGRIILDDGNVTQFPFCNSDGLVTGPRNGN